MLLPILVAVQAASAQLPAVPERPADERLITQYRLDRWTDTDGLPQNSLNALVQTTDGFLWLASEEGLIRFDGQDFIVFNHVNTPALERSQALALAAGRDGSLWAGLAGGGVVRYQGSRFHAYGTDDGLPSGRVQALAVDPSGDVWAGTARGLARIAGDGSITVVAGLPHQDVSAVAVVDGRVWVGTTAGLARVTATGTTEVYGTGDGLPHPDVRAVVPARDGGLWVGTLGGGVVHFDGARFTPLHARLAAEQVTSISEDAAGGVWVGTMSNGLHRVRGERMETLNAANGGAAMIWSLAHDAEGMLWVGTNGSGLLQLRQAPIVPLGVAEGLSEEIALAVLQTRDGTLWVGTANAGLNRIRPDGTVRRFGTADGLPERRVLSLAELPDGDLLIGAPNGALTRYRDGRFIDAGRGLDLRGSVMAILPDPAGGFWLGTTGGLVRVADGTVSWRLTTDDGLADDFIMTLHHGADGAVWAGTRQGVSRVVDGRVAPFAAASALHGIAVGAFFDAGDNGLWAATQGSGIVRIDGPSARFLRVSDGLCEDMVHAIVDDGAGSAWMSSNRGLFRLPMADLAAWFGGAGMGVQCRLYDRPEGMRSREANGGFMPAAAHLADGRIVFPTMQGIVTVDPRLFVAAAPPPRPTLRRAVMESDTMAVLADGIVVGTRRRDVEFHFTAPFYRGGDRLQFRYRLEGFDAGWREAGIRRSAHYTNLPPGDYVFQVIAGNEDGEWHPAAADVAVTVPYRYHETWWFRLLVAVLVAGIAVRWHRHRTMMMQVRAERLRALVEERSRAEERYRDLFENASDMVFTTDRFGVVTSWNSQAEAMTGWSKDEAVGRSIAQIIPPLAELVDGQRGDASFATRMGTTAVVEFAARVIEEHGDATGYQVTGRDMREWRQMQVQLEHAARMEAVGKLAGGIAHDFNNLLTVITSSSEIVTTELPPESPLRPDLRQIRAAADSAAGLTRQLLAFSRRQMLQPRVVDVNDQVVKVVGMLRRIIGVDIQLETALAPDTWPVCADEGQLEQVLMNLALNARDAMPDGGVLRFSTAKADVTDADAGALDLEPGSYVVLAIEDTGTGIEKDVLPHVFEPFFTTKPAGRGTGLGLATVYGVVKQSGGHILVDSTPGAGTCFRIFLPRTSRTDLPAAEQVGESPDGERSTARVLLAEDEPAVRRLAERILSRHGFVVRSAASGGEALALLQDGGPVDLLVTDMVMPGMNGRELAQQVQTLYPDTRILYMSGYTEDEFIRGGMLPEGEQFLPKPFTPRALVDAAGSVLAG